MAKSPVVESDPEQIAAIAELRAEYAERVRREYAAKAAKREQQVAARDARREAKAAAEAQAKAERKAAREVAREAKKAEQAASTGRGNPHAD
jgi:hypothetical protein